MKEEKRAREGELNIVFETLLLQKVRSVLKKKSKDG